MNPVQSIQHMLNHLARTIHTLPRLAETAIFDEPTLEAVMIFQRDFGLPVTGILEQTTWNAITSAYYQNLNQYGEPSLLSVFPNGVRTIQESESGIELLLVQVMISALKNVISNLEPDNFTGQNSGATLRNLKVIQQLASIPDTGTLDRATWAILAALYRAYVTRSAISTFPLSV